MLFQEQGTSFRVTLNSTLPPKEEREREKERERGRGEVHKTLHENFDWHLTEKPYW
jgi:hypothetical protein